MKNELKKSKAESVLTSLQSGKTFTAKQIEATFQVSSGRGVVQSLRKKGYAIYSNSRTNSRGVTKNFYKLGTPTRKMVAAGYAALGNDAFRRSA
jgi:hypothetical protein